MRPPVILVSALAAACLITAAVPVMKPGAHAFVAIAATIGSLVIAIASALTRPDSRPRRIPLLLALTIITASTVVSDWPLQSTFPIFASRLDSTASAALRGDKNTTPFWIGPYRILSTEITPQGTLCFWTNLNPSGRAGFVMTTPEHLHFNLWSATQLNARWMFISED